MKQAADPPAFRAIIRHELAHIRNRDVGITYFTLAVWYAFLLVAVLPLRRRRCSARTSLDLERHLATRACSPRLVYLTRNAVLRSREVYADLRASVPDGPGRGAAARAGELPRPAARIRLTRVRRVHPDPDSPARGARRHPAALPARRRRRVRRRPDRDDRLRQRRHAAVLVHHRPVDLRFAAALAYAPLAVGVVGVASGARRSPPSRTGASPPRPGSTASRSQPVSCSGRSSHSTVPHAREHAAPGPDELRRARRGRPCSSPGSRSCSPGSGRARPRGSARSAAAGRAPRADAGPARRRRRAHGLRRHVLRRTRARATARTLTSGGGAAACRGRRGGVGRPAPCLAVRDGRRAARHRPQAVLRARARAARALPLRRGASCPPRPTDAPWAFLDPGGQASRRRRCASVPLEPL